VFSISDSITHGGPAVITVLITVGLAIWAALLSGALRFGREVDYRDQIIEQQAKTMEEMRTTNAALTEANRQQALTAQNSLDLIKTELLPRLARSGGA